MALTKKQLINMRTNSKSLKDAEGRIKVSEVAILQDKVADPDTGDVKEVTKGFILSENGVSYGTISATAIEVLQYIEDILADGEDVEVEVLREKSAKGREYISLMVY